MLATSAEGDASGAHLLSERGPDFRLLFESSPALMMVLDLQLNIIAVSDSYCRATVTERAAIVGRHLFEVFPDNPDETRPTGVGNLRMSLARAVSDKVPDAMALQKYDIRVQKDGRTEFETRYWSCSNTPVMRADGVVQCIIHKAEDVTDYVRLRQRYADDTAELGDLKDQRTRMEAELVERALEIQSNNEKLRDRKVELEERVESEVKARARAVDALRASEEHVRNMELRATQDALERVRNVFNRFFTLSIDLMCICSTEGYFLRVNPAFKALGWSEQELLSKPFMEFIHPEDRQTARDNLRKLERGNPTSGTENRYLMADGGYRWISWNSTPEGDGTVYAIGRDVTDDRKVGDELRRAKALADSANRELESFSYTVAHDLRAPLRSIDGFSQALLEDYADKLDAEGKNYLSRLRGGAQRMATLIDDLLALSKLSRGEVHIQHADLSAIACGIVERLRETHPTRKVEVHIEDGLWAMADARLLTNALENLIGNAWKFTAKREGARIDVGMTTKDGQRAFFVRDNGAGFDMAYQHKLFGAFQRLHAVQEFEGTGIGLASVQRVINRHGGRIWPEAAVDRGATFYFTLPGEELS